MKTRVASILAALSVAFGIASAVLAGFAYASVMESRAAAPAAREPNFWDASVPDPSLPAYPALPDADHLPESFTPQQREDATIWLQQQRYVDECMADAGYDDWRFAAKWQTGVPGDFHKLWVQGLSGLELQRAYNTLLGSPEEPQSGVTYMWEENGCQGYGWHEVGVDLPVVY